MHTGQFSLNRDEYKDTPLHGKVATWDQPDTASEAIEGKHFATEKALLQAAINQLRVKRGHVFSDHAREIKAATVTVQPDGTRLDKDGKVLTFTAFEVLEAEARKVSIAEVTPRVPGTGSTAGKAKERIEKAEAEATAAQTQMSKMLAAMSDKGVRAWLDQQIITEEQYKAEMERRAKA